jgi:hypothetical protein
VSTIDRSASSLAGLGMFLVVSLLACRGEPPVIEGCAVAGGVSPLCGFLNPEDLALLPGGAWIVVSQFPQLSEPGGGGGSLVGLRLSDERRIVLYPGEAADSEGSADWGSPECSAPVTPERFSPHGVDVGTGPDGRPLLAVVHHGERESVEFFEIEQVEGEPRLSWRGCVRLPERIWPNDVALIDDHRLLVTDMMPPIGELTLDTIKAGLGIAFGRNTGAVLEWSRENGWSRLPDSEGSAPNGVVTSADGSEVYFAEWGASRLVRLRRDAPEGQRRREVALPHHPDNITWTRDGHLLVTGQEGGFGDLMACNGVRGGTCALDYSVVLVDPLSLDTRVVWRGQGAGTVALEVGEQLYIGTFAGDRIARVAFVH